MTDVDDELLKLPISLLDEPSVPMRPVVKGSIEYLERRDSIERHGFLNSILVRPSPRNPGRYEIIDGMWRFTAAVDLGRETIPCIIKHGLSDTEVLAFQIQANEVRKETTPTEIARHFRRIMAKHPEMTAGDLSRLAGKHPSYVKEKLGLLKLSREVQMMVDRREIPAQSAYMLAKLPKRWRDEQLHNARTMTAREFCPIAASLIKQFSEHVQQGRMLERFVAEFKPHPYLRGVQEIKAELDNPTVGATVLVTEGCKTLTDAWNACLRWALNLDKESVERRKRAAEDQSHKDLDTEDYDDAPELGKA